MTGTFYRNVKISLRNFFQNLLSTQVDNLYLDEENENIDGDSAIIVFTSIARNEDAISSKIEDTIQLNLYAKNMETIEELTKFIIDNLTDRKIDVLDYVNGTQSKIGEVYLSKLDVMILPPDGEYKISVIRIDYEYYEEGF